MMKLKSTNVLFIAARHTLSAKIRNSLQFCPLMPTTNILNAFKSQLFRVLRGRSFLIPLQSARFRAIGATGGDRDITKFTNPLYRAFGNESIVRNRSAASRAIIISGFTRSATYALKFNIACRASKYLHTNDCSTVSFSTRSSISRIPSLKRSDAGANPAG